MPHAAAAECSQFTSFTGTKVLILPQQDLGDNALELHLCLDSLPCQIACDILLCVRTFLLQVYIAYPLTAAFVWLLDRQLLQDRGQLFWVGFVRVQV